ncbi:MAG: hypothetical protein H7199_11515 [Burkholderiales bacterium]|nr:hypothetical protein [Flavobacterium sp.]
MRREESLEINLHEISKGQYMVKLCSNNSCETLKFVKV